MTDREIIILMLKEREAHRLYSRMSSRAYFEPKSEAPAKRKVLQSEWKKLNKQLTQALDEVEKSL